MVLEKLDHWGFPGGAVVKNLPSNTGNTGSIPGQGTQDPTCMLQLRVHMPQLRSPLAATKTWYNQKKNKKLDHCFTPYTKINSKWHTDLNVTPETIKLLEENIGSKLLDICLGDGFLDLTTKAKATKAEINKWAYSEWNNFCTAKETIHKIKRQPTEWGKIFANHIPNKVLIPKTGKEVIRVNSKKPPKNQKKKKKPTKPQTIWLKNGGPWDFPCGTVVTNPPANAGDTSLIPGPGKSHMPRSK